MKYKSEAHYIRDFPRNIILKNLKSYSWAELMRKCGIKYGSVNLKNFNQRLKLESIVFAPIDKNILINREAFTNVNTKEQCYWLGFISADGYVPKDKNMIRFSLSIKDEELLNSFISFINADLKKKTYSTGASDNGLVHFSIHDKFLADSVKRIGIVSPKGKNLKLLDFGKEDLNLAYLMGFYDGDGYEKTPTIACGSNLFLEAIKIKYNLKNKIRFSKNHWGSSFDFNIGIELYKKLIENYPESLPRKRCVGEYKSAKNECPLCSKLKMIESKV